MGLSVYLATHGANLVKHTGQEGGVADQQPAMAAQQMLLCMSFSYYIRCIMSGSSNSVMLDVQPAAHPRAAACHCRRRGGGEREDGERGRKRVEREG